jgi:hypothetical protein
MIWDTIVSVIKERAISREQHEKRTDMCSDRTAQKYTGSPDASCSTQREE